MPTSQIPRKGNDAHSLRSWLRISVIVPSYNEGAWIRKTVDSLLATDYPDWELIVVDDLSTDGSTAFLKEAPYAQDERIRFLQNNTQENWGVSVARHEGTTLATGNLFVFTDGHVEVDQKWLTLLVKAFEENPKMGIAGMRVYDLEKPEQKTDLGLNVYVYTNRDITMWAPHWLKGVQFEQPTRVPFVIACALAVPRTVYETLNGFPHWIRNWGPEDRSFCMMAYYRGYDTYMLPNISLGHYYKVGEKVSKELSEFRKRHLIENCLESCYLLYNDEDFLRAKARLQRYSGASTPLEIKEEWKEEKETLQATWVRSYDDFLNDFKDFLPYRYVEFLTEARAQRDAKEYEQALATFQHVDAIPYGYALADKVCFRVAARYEMAKTLYAMSKRAESETMASGAVALAGKSPVAPQLYLHLARCAKEEGSTEMVTQWLSKAGGLLKNAEQLAKISKAYELVLPINATALTKELEELRPVDVPASLESALSF